jgi:uncharacterized protein YndB with AHSA1/START domain
VHLLIVLSLLVLSPPRPQADALEGGEPLDAEAVVSAPLQAVWEAFTTREGIEAWQAARASAPELKPGATWLTSYSEDSDLGDDAVIETEILAVDPMRMLATKTVRAPADFPFPTAIQEAWSVLYFEPVSDSETRVRVRMLGFSDSSESQEMRAFFEWGNAYELDQLVEHFREADSAP